MPSAWAREVGRDGVVRAEGGEPVNVRQRESGVGHRLLDGVVASLNTLTPESREYCVHPIPTTADFASREPRGLCQVSRLRPVSDPRDEAAVLGSDVVLRGVERQGGTTVLAPFDVDPQLAEHVPFRVTSGWIGRTHLVLWRTARIVVTVLVLAFSWMRVPVSLT